MVLRLKPIELATGRPVYDQSLQTDRLDLIFAMTDTIRMPTVTVTDEQATLKLDGACRH